MKITYKKLDRWLRKYRPELALWEHGKKKGIYEKRLGPAFSFQVRGETWRDVFYSLVMDT